MEVMRRLDLDVATNGGRGEVERSVLDDECITNEIDRETDALSLAQA